MALPVAQKFSSSSSKRSVGGAVALTILCCAVGALQCRHLLLLYCYHRDAAVEQQEYRLQTTSRTDIDNNSCRNDNKDRPAQKIFLDVGANRGDVLRIFLDRGRQPEDSNNRQWKFGIADYDPQEWRIIAFEASPRMIQPLQQLQQEYSNVRQQQPLELHVPVAVWTSDGDTIPLGIDDTTEEQKGWLAGEKHGEWGSSVLYNATETVVAVPTLDLSRFVRELTACAAPTDILYLKMNVEGAEFSVIRHMIAQGTLCRLNHVDVYWHSHLIQQPEAERQRWKTIFIPMVRQYLDWICPETQIHVWGVH